MIRSIHILLIMLAGIFAGIVYRDAGLFWWACAIAMYFVFGCLGVVVTFHRYLSHRSFQFRWWWLERLFILFGHLAGSGSAIGWVAVHKAHHAYSDTDRDPHGPRRGWRNFVPDYDDVVNYRMVRSMLRDRYLRWLHKNGILLIAAYYLALWLIGGDIAVAFFGGIPQAITILMSVITNWVGHVYGYQTYETGEDSRNCWWLAIPAWGESWHNNHHAKPGRASFSHKWWEIDISGAVIALISKQGTMK
ncbi:acyl-CoA desaturase [Shimia sp.]|uniref:acyl-CoA desaturase n=1 Tax=Shimia sp. TaxID=1954381 RepID=UPI003BA88E7E